MAKRFQLHAAWFYPASIAIVALGVGLEYPRFAATFQTDRVFFWGPDSYTRIERVKRLMDGQSLRNRQTSNINAPHGAEMHWTTPMDSLLAGAALVAQPLVRNHDPVEVAAAAVPPALGAIYLACMISVMGRGFGRPVGLACGLLAALTPAFHRAFRLGHPDHHGLIELLLLLSIGGWIAARRSDGAPAIPSRRAIAVSGIAMGLSIWIATQPIIVWLIIVAGIWLGMRSAPCESRTELGRRLTKWSRCVFFVVFVAYLFENLPVLNCVSADRISLVHVALTALPLIWPPAQNQSAANADRSARTRWLVFALATTAFVVWIGLDRDRVFGAMIRPEFQRWSSIVAELQPLVVRTPGDWSVRPMLDHLGLLPFALPVLAVFLLRSGFLPRPTACVLCGSALVMTLLAIVQIRWLDHVNHAGIPVAVLGTLALLRIDVRPAHTPLRPIRTAAAVIVLAVIVFPAARTVWSERSAEVESAMSIQRRTAYVADRILEHQSSHASAAGPRNIMCDEGDGALLAYWTGLPVVAAPYHRAIDGIIEAARFYAESDPQRARRRLDRLGVRYVVAPFRAHEQLMNFERIAYGGFRSFDQPHEWIDEIGRRRQRIRYRDGHASTMAYRLFANT
ncbi:MAG: hypothetical protein V3T70_08055, partial [Phycisphaerae bacterium]